MEKLSLELWFVHRMGFFVEKLLPGTGFVHRLGVFVEKLCRGGSEWGGEGVEEGVRARLGVRERRGRGLVKAFWERPGDGEDGLKMGPGEVWAKRKRDDRMIISF